MYAYLDTVGSPAGPLAIAVNAEGALLAVQFTEGRHAVTIERDLERAGYTPARDADRTAEARRQFAEYDAGTRQTFTLPLVFAGTDWQNAVWRALAAIPFGATRTYGQIAATLGAPGSSRAVGQANGRNPLPVIVPCHRVVGSDGTLTGFGGGLPLKVRLLAHEARKLGAVPLLAESGATVK